VLVVLEPVASTVVVVTWRGAAHIAGCLDAVAAQTRAHSLLVVDNASDDGTAEILGSHPSHPRVLRLPHNAGYAGALAAALSEVDTRYVAWLNDDAEPAPSWLGHLEDALDVDDSAAAASARLELPDESTQSVGVGLTPIGYGFDLTVAGPEVFGFCGGAALLRVDALRAVGGVPAEFFCYYEDTDSSWRLQLAGWRVLAVPEARVRHAHGASTRLGSAAFHRWNERNRLLMLIRCAPATVAVRELARFTALTVVLPLRRVEPMRPSSNVVERRTHWFDPKPGGENFRVRLRLRVLVDVTRGLPAALRARRAAGASAARRRAVWRRWAGG